MVVKASEICPRFVWGRRPRPNCGRRRPCGRTDFYKHSTMISRGSYPVSAKALLSAAPHLDEVMLLSSLGLTPISAKYRLGCGSRIRVDDSFDFAFLRL